MSEPTLPGNEVAARAFRASLKAAVVAVAAAQGDREAIGPDGLSDLNDSLTDEIRSLLTSLNDAVATLVAGADAVDDD